MRKSLKKVLVGVLLLSQIFSQIPVFASEADSISGNSIAIEEPNEESGVVAEPVLESTENTEGNEIIEEVIEETESTEDVEEVTEEPTEVKEEVTEEPTEVTEEITEEVIEEVTEEPMETTEELESNEEPSENIPEESQDSDLEEAKEVEEIEETTEVEEEEAEELKETEEEEIEYPEFSGSSQANGVDCTFSAEEGVVPNGAKLVFGGVADTSAINEAILNSLDNDETNIKLSEVVDKINSYEANKAKISRKMFNFEEIEQKLNTLVDVSGVKVSDELVDMFIERIIYRGNDEYLWVFNLTGNANGNEQQYRITSYDSDYAESLMNDDNFDIVARFIIPLSECKKYCEKKVGRGFKEKFWKPLIIKIAVVAY